MCKTAKTVDARTTDLSFSLMNLMNKQKKRERETNVIDNSSVGDLKIELGFLHLGKPTEPTEFTEQMVANL